MLQLAQGQEVDDAGERMTVQQLFVFAVLVATLAMFIWNRWRYDVVAATALLVVAIAGIVPPGEVFSGFGHPAVITVAAVLVLSRGLMNAGVVDMIARLLWRVGENPMAQVAALTGIVALLSAFMNNVGALALLMPVAITISRRRNNPQSMLLMPLAFGSLLGGMLTLIGTPPNIILAAYRAETGAEAFRMFDFLPVGGAVALAGVVFISLVGWRLVPRRTRAASAEDLFDISDYIAEVLIPADSRFANRSLQDLMSAVQEEAEVLVLGLFRGELRESMPPMFVTLRAGDILLVEVDSDGLRTLLDVADAELVDGGSGAKSRAQQDAQALDLREVIVTAESPLVRTTVVAHDMRRRFGVNIIAVARQGGQLREAIKDIRFEVGDILLVQGPLEAMSAACSELLCLPLADRDLRFGRPRKLLLTIGLFGGALALAAVGALPAAIALSAGAIAMILTGIISPAQAYNSLDLPVVVLLAAMIPVGEALESSGGAQLIADSLAAMAGATTVAGMLTVLMLGTMLLSNVVNNAAAAILVAPIAIDLSGTIGVSADPFLMSVAVGASAAFLTPIGHQSNTLVMTPGGYRFGDYWRLGLPVSIIVVLVAVPLIMRVWPPV
jgi:di/tricarboxylate transporter